MNKRATVTDPSHELYGRVVVVQRESEWYTHVRPLYFSTTAILTKNQYVINQTENH